ncbi:hypothetical protein D3C76_1711990 [compost metagenome]
MIAFSLIKIGGLIVPIVAYGREQNAPSLITEQRLYRLHFSLFAAVGIKQHNLIALHAGNARYGLDQVGIKRVIHAAGNNADNLATAFL